MPKCKCTSGLARTEARASSAWRWPRRGPWRVPGRVERRIAFACGTTRCLHTCSRVLPRMPKCSSECPCQAGSWCVYIRHPNECRRRDGTNDTSLTDNQIGDAGAAALSEALKSIQGSTDRSLQTTDGTRRHRLSDSCYSTGSLRSHPHHLHTCAFCTVPRC
jgi:hypothetical protein